MSKKIILRQSVKSGVAVVFFFGLGMASINAQTTQTTQPTGKVGINTTNPKETLEVNGTLKVSTLPANGAKNAIYNGQNTKNTNFTAAHMVVVDKNGVLGKQDLPTIPTMPTIPTEPWQVAGGSTQATSNSQDIYQSGKVGIGNYSTNSTMESSFEINGGGSKQLGLINGPNKWDISTENKALTFTKRKPDNGRIFSVTQDAKLFLGNNLLSEGGSNAKVILDGGNGKIGIGKNSAEYNLDVEGDAKISGLKTTSDNITNGSTTSKYSPAKMVVVDENGVLGKQDFPTIPTMPTIPTEPWRQLGGTNEATTNTQNIYQNGKVGIGDYTSTSTFDSDFEVNSNHNGYHVGIANGADTKWNLSAESGNERAFTITKRHSDGAGRLLSITKEAKLYLGNTLTTPGGGNTKITLDGKDGNIILIDKWRVGLKGNSLMFYDSPTTGDSNNKFTLTNEGKLFLGKDLNGDGNGTGANILLDGKEGKVAIGHNSPAEALDVKGKAKIQTIEKQTATTGLDMVVVGADGVLKKADIPTGGGSGNGVKNHTGSNDDVQCDATNAGTIHYKEEVTVNGHPTSVMGFCMKTANKKYRWFYIFGGAGTTTGSEDATPNFGKGL